MENEEIKEEKKKKKRKKKSGKGIYIILFLFVIVFFVALVIALNNVGLLDLSPLENVTGKKKVTLQYTEPAKEQGDGVYIVDVSDVVEEVMP